MIDLKPNTVLNADGIEATPAERRIMDNESARLGQVAEDKANEYQESLDEARVGQLLNKVAMVALKYPQFNEILEANGHENPYNQEDAVDGAEALLDEAVVELTKLKPVLAESIAAIAQQTYEGVTL